MLTKQNNECRMCKSDAFQVVLELGDHPLVNSLVSKEFLSQEDPVFPMNVYRCSECGLVQLKDIIDSNEIYKNVDYLYFSSDMPGLSQYFENYANSLKAKYLKKNDFVLEIGCNDGVMLEHFKNDFNILGVDPSTNVVLRTIKKGIPAIPLFFSERLANQIKFEWGQPNLIVANNCIAHLDDLYDLMLGVSSLLANGGVFVLECNYWGGMVKNTNYSLIYHDHYSYFSLKVWEEFSKKFKMSICDAEVTPAQGGSLRLYLCNDTRPMTERAKILLEEEKNNGLNTHDKCKEYAKNVQNRSKEISNLIHSLKKEGKKIAGYGAAAKGMTILKCSGIGKNEIDYFVDDSPAKQGWYSPVEHIPIISRKEAENNLPDYFFILAPNYSDVIIERESVFRNKGGKFIVPKENLLVI